MKRALIVVLFILAVGTMLGNIPRTDRVLTDGWSATRELTQVEFLEVGVTVNGAFTMKTYGPDANGVYGGMQGVGGLEAVTVQGHGSPIGLVQDYFGNVLGTIASGAVAWSPARCSSYGPVPGYQSPSLSLNVGLGQSLGWRGKRVDETGLICIGARLIQACAAGTHLKA